MHDRWSSILYYFWSYLTFFSLIRCWSVEISKGWKLSLAQWESLLLLLMWRFACPLTLTHTLLHVIIPCYLYLKFYAKREMGEKGWLNTLLLLLQTPVLCHEVWAFNFQKCPEDILIIGPFCRWVCKEQNLPTLVQPEPGVGTVLSNLAPAATLLATSFVVREDWTSKRINQAQSGRGSKWLQHTLCLSACPSMCFQAFFNYSPCCPLMSGFRKLFISPFAHFTGLKCS